MKTSIMTGRDIHDEIKKLESEIEEINQAFLELTPGSRSRLFMKNLANEKNRLLDELSNIKYQIYRSNEFGM